MKKLFSLPIRIQNGPMKGRTYNVDVPVTVSDKDLTKINLDASFLTGGSILAVMTTLATVGGAGGAAVATVGAVTITAGIIGSAVGIVGAVVALGIFVPALVNIIREANTTSMVLLNTVPNSTMRITKVVQDGGKWIDTDEAAILRDKALTNEAEAAALIFRSEPYRSAGRSKGHFEVELTFNKSGKKQHFHVNWDNPLGPDGPARQAVYSTSLPTSVNGNSFVFSPEPEVQHPSITRVGGRKEEKKRHDIVTFVIGPSTKGFEYI
ncbi:hypothetical protein [Lewinella cohaerens]|uniref:hypothetical protein n=1 Tax=Lewinella cohaerens TaxID=70995 RepID=UPI00037251B8|nr:hypothetical protein [Lewinella cohaerens]